MAARELWRVMLVLERDPDRQSEPDEWDWSALTDTHIEDVSAHFVPPTDAVQAPVHAAYSEEPLAEPLSAAQVQRQAAADPDGMIHMLVAVDLGDVIDHDVDWFLDELSYRAFGRIADFSYELMGFEGNSLRFAVHADADDLLDEPPAPPVAEAA